MFTKKIHDKLIYSRRVGRLTEILIPILNESKNILDLGCGDGKIDSLIMKRLPDVNIYGIDVLVRPETYIFVDKYDGKHIPLKDNAVDTIMAIDVLHHTDDPSILIKEMARCTSRYIVIKDHYKHGFISHLKLKAMDYVGNAHYKVKLPYNYLSVKKWEKIFEENELRVIKLERNLNLYKGLFHILFDRNLHFIAKLEKGSV